MIRRTREIGPEQEIAREREAHRRETQAAAPLVCVAADFGFRRNSSAAAAAVREGNMVRLVAWIEWKPGIDPLVPSSVFRGVARLCAAVGCDHVIADGHARDSALEVFRPAGLRFVSAPASPAAVHLEVQRLLRERRVRGLGAPGVIVGEHRPGDADDLLVRQLEDIRGTWIDGGAMRIEIPTTPDGRHGDVAVAATTSLWGASRLTGAERGAPIGAALDRS